MYSAMPSFRFGSPEPHSVCRPSMKSVGWSAGGMVKGVHSACEASVATFGFSERKQFSTEAGVSIEW